MKIGKNKKMAPSRERYEKQNPMRIPVKLGHRSAPNQATCPVKSATHWKGQGSGAGLVLV